MIITISKSLKFIINIIVLLKYDIAIFDFIEESKTFLNFI